MLERNILSHLKLALLLSLLSSSLILHARLIPAKGTSDSAYNFPLAIVEFIAAMIAVVAGVWEYFSGCADLKNARAFLTGVKLVFLHNLYLSRLTIFKATFYPYESRLRHCLWDMRGSARCRSINSNLAKLVMTARYWVDIL